MTDLPTTGDYITQLYLYGQTYTPSDLTDRLRDLAPSQNGSQITIDAENYMETYGVYAVPARAKFVQDFFNGAVTLSVGTHTVADLLQNHSANDFTFTIQQAQIDVGNNNYMDRAFIFNHGDFVLSNDTKFTVDSNGNLSMIDVKVLPVTDNFDFESTEGSLAQYLDEIYLQPTIDPSKIGRKVEILFGGTVSSQAYTASAYAADIGKIASWQVSTAAAGLAIGANIISYVEDMRSRGVFETERDGKTIIYDGQRTNYIDSIGIDDGAILVAGSQNDVISTYDGNDIAYGGDGDDLFTSSQGADQVFGGNELGKPEITDSDEMSYALSPTSITVTLNGSSDIIVQKDDLADTLHSIEAIKGTDFRDYFNINGDLPENSYLLLDAGAGQTGNDIIHFADDLNINIDNDGHGFVTSNATSGIIELLNFHTQIIASDYANSITDNSVGGKRIDGGDGNDLIVGAGGPLQANGGDGDDTITGGVGNDVLAGGEGSDVINGGIGSDYLLGSSNVSDADLDDEDILLGGLGSDYLVNGAIMTGGGGNDIYDARGWLSGEDGQWAHIHFSAGDGNDSIVSAGRTGTIIIDPSTSAVLLDGVGEIDLSDYSLADAEIIWNVSGLPEQTVDGYDYYEQTGDLAITFPTTGDSILFSGVSGNYRTEAGGVPFTGYTTYFIGLPSLVFNDGVLRMDDGGSNVPVIAGDTTPFDTSMAWATATHLDPIVGTSGNDYLAGGAGDDDLSGGDGDDEFSLTGGNDTIDGGLGYDTISLFDYAPAYEFDVAADGSIIINSSNPLEGSATLKGIESVYYLKANETIALSVVLGFGTITGTTGDDVIIGTSGVDHINGLEGNDSITGAGADDVLDGGDGTDVAQYSGSSFDYRFGWIGDAASVEDLRFGSADGRDVLTNVENFQFSSDNTTVALTDFVAKGTGSADTITGTARSDVIDGEGDNDVLIGAAGNDLINGNSGNDIAQYSGMSSDYRIGWNDGKISIEDLRSGHPDGADLLTDVEAFAFAGDSTTLTTNDIVAQGVELFEAIDYITGTARADRIEGANGQDTIDAGAGDDVIKGRGEHDVIDGGDGYDEAVYTGSSSDYSIWLGAGGLEVSDYSANFADGYDELTNVESLYFESDNFRVVVANMDINGTSGSDILTGTTLGEIISGFEGDDVLNGGAGSDDLDGGEGADTMNGGSGDDYYYVDNTGDTVTELSGNGFDAVYSSITYTLPANVEELDLFGDVAINGTGNSLDNLLWGDSYSNILSGLAGDDDFYAGDGDDTIVGGLGDDTMQGEDGDDTAVFAGAQNGYAISTFGGLVIVTDTAPSTAGDEGRDTLAGMETAQFSDGQVSLASPIILDLDGNGVSLVDRAHSKAKFDWNGDGARDKTGWAGKGDGILFLDRDGNGKVSGADELSFVGDKAGAKSDLDGLAAFDTNGDGVLSAADDRFADFKVWRDKNGDGKFKSRESLSLSEAGVASINLSGTATEQDWGWDDNILINAGSFTRTNGSGGQLGDVALNYDRAATRLRSADAVAVSRSANLFAEAIAAFANDEGGDNIAAVHDEMSHRQPHFAAGGSLR